MFLQTAVKNLVELAESPILWSLWNSLTIAALAAPFALFLEFCFQKGNVFRKYFALVAYWFNFKPRARIYDLCDLDDPRLTREIRHKGGKALASRRLGDRGYWEARTLIVIPARWFSWFFKPLGGCVYCFGTWIAIAFFILAIGDPLEILTSIGALQFLATLGLNYLIIDLYKLLKTRFE